MLSRVKANHIPRLVRMAARYGRNRAGLVLTGGTALTARPVRERLCGLRPLSEVLTGQRVLVSGASSGIGRAVALKVAEAGGIAVLVARSGDSLRELKAEIKRRGGSALVYSADLSAPASVNQLLARLAADGVVIDVLVNNAGRSIRRSIADAYDRAHDYERTMAINYFGAIRLILGLLPGMRERKKGHVINVSSASVLLGTPLFSAYVASKSALDAFTRVAGVEARADGVRFTTVHMPLVRTPMIAPTEAYRDVPALSPEEAADAVLRALATHEKQLGTRLATLINLAHALAPEALERVLSLGQRWASEPTPVRDVDEQPQSRAA